MVDRLTNRGFRYDENMSMELREGAELEWFKETVMVFYKEERMIGTEPEV